MGEYAQDVSWTRFNGSMSELGVEDCETPEQAFNIAINQARKLGWTPPRWWQWWRRHDQPRSAKFSD